MEKLYPKYFPLVDAGDGIKMPMFPTDDARVIKTTCKYYFSETPMHTYRLVANGKSDDEEFDVYCPYCHSIMSPITILADVKLTTYVCEQCNFKIINKNKENKNHENY